METAAKFIFFFLIGTTVLNLVIAIAARLKTKQKIFNQLVFYWVSLFATYFAAALLSKTPTEIAFAYFLQFIPTFIVSKILMDSREIRFNLKYFMSLQLIGTTISTYLLLATDAGFTLSLLPITISTALPMFLGMWNVLVTERGDANWIEIGMGILFFTGIINHFNYAFFRLDPNAAWWGWSISIAQYQCISIFLPLLMNHRRELKERQNLELALQKMAVKHAMNVDVDELYRKLETEISLKEELTKKLKKSNSRLEEEQQMNEVLIQTVSHDIANPMTVINAYVDMMQMGRIPEEDKNMILGRIKNNTKAALDMIARIRSAIVTRSQASLVAIHNVSIDRSIKNLLGQFDARLKEKNIQVDYQNSTPLDIFVLAEENTLTEHVFANALSNAIKFSHENSKIKITVSEIGNMIEVEFRDFGVGIDQRRLAHKHLQTTEGTNGETGTGFGMMLMGQFLRHFGGRYRVYSEGTDRGTSVTICLKKSDVINANLQAQTSVANIFS